MNGEPWTPGMFWPLIVADMKAPGPVELSWVPVTLHWPVTDVVVPEPGGLTVRPVLAATPQPSEPVCSPELNVTVTGPGPQRKVAEKAPPPQVMLFGDV